MKAYGNYIIVEPLQNNEVLKQSGLVIPQHTKKTVRITKGRIESVNDKMLIGNKWVDTKLNIGDEILYNGAMGYAYQGKNVVNIEGVIAVL